MHGDETEMQRQGSASSELATRRDGSADLATAGAAPSEELPAEFLEKLRSGKRKRRVKLAAIGVAAIAAAIAVCTALALGAGAGNEAKETTGTYTQQVTKGTLDMTVEGSGTLSANSTTSVSPEVSGTVKKVYVEQGDSVKEGDTLFTLTSDELEDAAADAYEQAQEAYSAYKKAYKAYKKAQKSSASSSSSSTSASSASGASAAASGTAKSGSAASDESSNQDNAPSAQDTDQATVQQASLTTQTAAATQADSSSVDQAWSAYKQAKSAYEDAVADLDKLTVKATASGTVTDMGIAKGDTLSSSSADSAAVTISDLSKMTMTVQVSEYDVSNIKKGQAATVTVKAVEKTVSAKVSSVNSTASSSNSTGGSGSGSSSSTAYFDVELLIDEPTSEMLEGMNATAEIVYESYEDALLVPTSAVTTDPRGESSVTVQAGEEQTSQVSVTVLGGNDETTAVEGDLAEGDEVVVTYQISDSDSSSGTGSGQMRGMGGMGSMGGLSDMGGSGNRPGGNSDGASGGRGEPPSGGPGGMGANSGGN